MRPALSMFVICNIKGGEGKSKLRNRRGISLLQLANANFWALSGIFGHVSVEITGDEGELHNEVVHSRDDQVKAVT
jgi:hypothetical protein